MDKSVNLIRDTFVSIFVSEPTPANYLFCDNQILPDLTNVVVIDKSFNSFNAYTRLQSNTNVTQFIDNITNTPIPNVYAVRFYPFKEAVHVFDLSLDALSSLDSDINNSSNGIVTYVSVTSYNKFFYEIKTATYIKNSYQTHQVHAKICTSLQFYIIECLQKISLNYNIDNLEVVDKNKTVVFATVYTQR